MAQVTETKIVLSSGHEVVTVTDDYGSSKVISIPFSDSANRQNHIDAAVAVLNTNQTAMETYAATHKIPLPPKQAKKG